MFSSGAVSMLHGLHWSSTENTSTGVYGESNDFSIQDNLGKEVTPLYVRPMRKQLK